VQEDARLEAQQVSGGRAQLLHVWGYSPDACVPPSRA
jgi:hypothetical protein